MKLTTDFHLLPRLRMNETAYLLHYMHSWRVQEKLYISNLIYPPSFNVQGPAEKPDDF
jgi:hypothetical protein